METVVVSTGLYLSIPDGYEVQLRSRSGLSIKGIVVANSPATIDADYTGEVKVILRNQGKMPYIVKNGDRIAQMVLAPVFMADFYDINPEDLPKTQRGNSGFGSTGLSSN